MVSKECFHFTKLDRAYSIRDTGLQARLENNSKSVGDTKSKISYSDSKIGAIGLFAIFYEVYTDYKTGARKPRNNKPGEKETYEAIMKSASFEEYLGDGMYLIFDGTGIENTGGNTGHGGIYDASTITTIPSHNIQVGLIRNNDTKEISYSKFEYIHFLMSTMRQDEFSQMIPSMQKRYEKYYREHQSQIDKYRTGNFSEAKINIADFCRFFKDDIDKAIRETKTRLGIVDTSERISWKLSSEEFKKYNEGVKQVLENQINNGKKENSTLKTDLQL